jgi:ATP-dependent Zn protease
MTRRKPSFLNIPRHTAIHEAGHAVIARRLTLSCGSTTIKPDFAEGHAGHAVTDDPYACIHQWERRGKVRGINSVWYGRIVALMAGAEAEIAILGSTQGGDGKDRSEIELMAEEISSDPLPWNLREVRLRAMTRMLIRRHRDRIQRVAEALLAKKTLSAKAIDKLAGRSVDDVTMNAPFIAEMHRRNEIELKANGRKQ